MSTITGQKVMTGNESNWRLFRTFLNIDRTDFAVFVAINSFLQNYLAGSKKLFSHDETLNGNSFVHILTGPKAVKSSACDGFKISGVTAAVVSATAVIIPAFLLLLIFSYVFSTWGEMSAVSNIFNGFKPDVAVVILLAVIIMRSKCIKNFKRLYAYKKNNNYVYLTKHCI